MWSQDQASADSHDERLARVRQMVQEEVRGGQPQVTDRDVHGAVVLFNNLARRVGAVPRGAPLPAAIRSQRWSPLTMPLLWSAAGEDQSVPIVEWLATTASAIREPVQFHGEQASGGDSLGTSWAALRSVMRSWAYVLKIS